MECCSGAISLPPDRNWRSQHMLIQSGTGRFTRDERSSGHVAQSCRHQKLVSMYVALPGGPGKGGERGLVVRHSLSYGISARLYRFQSPREVFSTVSKLWQGPSSLRARFSFRKAKPSCQMPVLLRCPIKLAALCLAILRITTPYHILICRISSCLAETDPARPPIAS